MATLHIPNDVYARLRRAAEAAGLSVEQWLGRVADTTPGPEVHSPQERRESFDEMMAWIEAQQAGRPATDADWSRDAAYPDEE